MASKIKGKIQDKWDLKFVKESRYMPFGSAMNAYGNINQGKGISVKKFLEDMFVIAEACQTLIEDSLKIANDYQDRAVEDSELPEINPDGETVSTKRQVNRKIGEDWQKKHNSEGKTDEERLAILREKENNAKVDNIQDEEFSLGEQVSPKDDND